MRDLRILLPAWLSRQRDMLRRQLAALTSSISNVEFVVSVRHHWPTETSAGGIPRPVAGIAPAIG